MTYTADRKFTDAIHQKLALPKIYAPLGWEAVTLERSYAEQIDNLKGIDYVFRKGNDLKTVQERFREAKYRQYSDFTIRYRRDNNRHAERQESEFYKMKAAFFTYGIVNGEKEKVEQCTDFLKFAVIDLEKVYEKIAEGRIIMRENGRNTCRIINNNIIECPIKHNRDGSSSFFPIEIAFLVRLFGAEIILAQKGFL